MPTYQYVCTVCGQDIEAVQSFSDAALTECPACSGRLRKKFGSVGVVFKGSGFYRTDSRSGAAAASSSEKSESKSSDSTSTGTEKPSGGDKPAKKESSSASTTSTSSTSSTSSSTAA